MLQYEKINVSAEIDVNISNKSKDKPYVCNKCHNGL